MSRLFFHVCAFILLLTAPALTSCNDLINPQRQKDQGLYKAVLERYGTAPGFQLLVSEPKFPGLKKGVSLKVDILVDVTDETKAKEVRDCLGAMISWYAEANSKMNGGHDKLWIYALKDGEPKWVGIYEAGALEAGKDLRVEEPSPENLPTPSEKP